ncbi:mitochondrial-processing peptidase subunit alpha protein [Purpureocillium lavendulum]|uniref:Mitochondrial-processing peptidase subunit alpha protein n=1 Tax=Purpureocillium lavendulum TaxID=1247861 RepID=A0AB34FM21_9HYPO|nr:mitochondrial-processing peptidase subunit alpha protein [Purpureocillium lavendulum]
MDWLSSLTGPRRGAKVIAGCSVFVCFALILQLLYLSSRFYSPPTSTKESAVAAAIPRKPANTTVSGLVFYGRKDRVSCLRCYLERNLQQNGGWLDEVLWVVNTDKEADLRYLDEIIESNPAVHRKLIIPGDKLWVYSYYKAWQRLDRGKYYVKIDDDILWMADDAIPRMVMRKIEHPQDFVVSANIINNPPLGFMHYNMGALHPYFPDTRDSGDAANGTVSWKPSHHPAWEGPANYTWPLDRKPPHKNHRWLRVQDENMMSQTPAAQLKYEVWGPSYESWAIAAQMHYSLLENIEKDRLDVYKFGTWDMHGERIRINFMCFYADDILDTDVENWPKNRGDEDMVVLDLPKKLKRAVTIEGGALGAHFQYSDQGDLGDTDLLRRYKLLADERVCQYNRTATAHGEPSNIRHQKNSNRRRGTR